MSEWERCEHCRKAFIADDPRHGHFCDVCDELAGDLALLISCDDGRSGCPKEGTPEALRRTNDDYAFAGFLDWAERAGRNVDPYMTYPEHKLVFQPCEACKAWQARAASLVEVTA